MNKVFALAATETKLVLRNKTVMISSLVLPIMLGAFFAYSFDADSFPGAQAVVLGMQLAIVLGMGVYVTATQTIVARRHSRVLKRMRTSGISDSGLLAATIAPSVAIGVLQLVLIGMVDVVLAIVTVRDPLAVVLAFLGGVALMVAAALATTIVTATPERSQITTLPLMLVLIGAAITLAVVPTEGWGHALIAIPGAVVGKLAAFAVNGGTWAAGLGGLPAVLPVLLAMVVWPVVLGVVAMRQFRWDPRT